VEEGQKERKGKEDIFESCLPLGKGINSFTISKFDHLICAHYLQLVLLLPCHYHHLSMHRESHNSENYMGLEQFEYQMTIRLPSMLSFQELRSEAEE
jgi:hypothetical protein